MVDQSPIASNEAGNSSDIVWQGDGSGNYDYNDYGGSDYDNSYDSSYDNSYDNGNDYRETIAAIIAMAVMTVEVILAAVTIMEETTAAEIIVETAPAMAVSKMEADIDQ